MVTAMYGQCMGFARLRGDIAAAYGHAMPFGLVKPCISGGTFNGPIFLFAQSLSVPIPGESPPNFRMIR